MYIFNKIIVIFFMLLGLPTLKNIFCFSAKALWVLLLTINIPVMSYFIAMVFTVYNLWILLL